MCDLDRLRAGQHVLVKFIGENEFHERILTSQVQGHLWMALTPDEDHYPHHLVEDVSEIFLVGPRGGVPVKASRQGLLTYRFRNKYSVDMLDAVIAEGATLAAEELFPRSRPLRRLRGKQAGPPVLPLGKLAPGRASAPHLPRPAIEDDEPPRDKVESVDLLGAPSGSDGVWLLAEPSEGYEIGLDVGAMVIDSTRYGRHALVKLHSGVRRSELVKLTAVDAWVMDVKAQWSAACGSRLGTPREAEPPSDARTLPVRREGDRRFRAFKESVDQFTEQEMVDWDIEGPRTVRYCAKEVSKNGLGPSTRYHQWRVNNKLDEGDAGLALCELISEVVEVAVCRDQLDISNLLCFEHLERKRQWIEEGYRQRLEDSRFQKSQGKDGSALTAEAFSGRPRMAGGAIICPALIAHVARKAHEDSELLRQQRKALEARGLAAPKKKA